MSVDLKAFLIGCFVNCCVCAAGYALGHWRGRRCERALREEEARP